MQLKLHPDKCRGLSGHELAISREITARHARAFKILRDQELYDVYLKTGSVTPVEAIMARRFAVQGDAANPIKYAGSALLRPFTWREMEIRENGGNPISTSSFLTSVYNKAGEKKANWGLSALNHILSGLMQVEAGGIFRTWYDLDEHTVQDPVPEEYGDVNHYVADAKRRHPVGFVDKFHASFPQFLAKIQEVGLLPSKGAGYDENDPDSGPVKLPSIYSCASRTTPFWSYASQGQRKDKEGRSNTLDAHEFVIPLQNDLQAKKGIPPIEKGFKVLCGLVPLETTPEYKPGCWARFQVCNYKGPDLRALKVQYAYPKPEVKIGWLEWICTSGPSKKLSDL